MEDVKWLLKKYGSLIVLMVIIVIAGSIVWEKRDPEKNAEEIPGNNVAEESVEEIETESETSLWFLPQAENCLITEAEPEIYPNGKGPVKIGPIVNDIRNIYHLQQLRRKG